MTGYGEEKAWCIAGLDVPQHRMALNVPTMKTLPACFCFECLYRNIYSGLFFSSQIKKKGCFLPLLVLMLPHILKMNKAVK